MRHIFLASLFFGAAVGLFAKAFADINQYCDIKWPTGCGTETGQACQPCSFPVYCKACPNSTKQVQSKKHINYAFGSCEFGFSSCTHQAEVLCHEIRYYDQGNCEAGGCLPLCTEKLYQPGCEEN